MSVADYLSAGAALAAILAALGSWHRWVKPRMKAYQDRERAKDFAILGGPVIDPLTGRTIATQPPIGQWMSGIDASLKHLSDLLQAQTQQAEQIADLEHRVAALEQSRTEQVITRAESAQAFALMNKLADAPALPHEDNDTD